MIYAKPRDPQRLFLNSPDPRVPDCASVGAISLHSRESASPRRPLLWPGLRNPSPTSWAAPQASSDVDKASDDASRTFRFPIFRLPFPLNRLVYSYGLVVLQETVVIGHHRLLLPHPFDPSKMSAQSTSPPPSKLSKLGPFLLSPLCQVKIVLDGERSDRSPTGRTLKTPLIGARTWKHSKHN